MDTWWIGTVSALAGTALGALLEALREKVAHRRALRTRWDQQLLVGIVDYLATADRSIRALLRWRAARSELEYQASVAQSDALSAFESMHERSQVITLLTGNRHDSVRAAARRMREPLLPLRDALEADKLLSDEQVAHIVRQHHDARAELIDAAQTRLGVFIR